MYQLTWDSPTCGGGVGLPVRVVFIRTTLMMQRGGCMFGVAISTPQLCAYFLLHQLGKENEAQGQDYFYLSSEEP
ncbi:MAG: hypothetical protein QOJ64_4574 [Acidobacteriota bacterium]|jgi:hypothetical protein|nr:hypothetical protein [Acidobacteriota bacterium]